MNRKFLLPVLMGLLLVFAASAENVLAQRRKAVSGREVTGTYRYSYTGKWKGNFSEIKILALGNNKLKVGFELTYPFTGGDGQPSANVGTAAGEAEINGDTAVYSNSEAGSCEIKIVFVKPGQIRVSQTEEGGGCGFGLNVSADGTYRKISSKTPVFPPADQ